MADIRDTMTDLVRQTRALVGDLTDQTFTDLEIEEVLDRHSQVARAYRLTPASEGSLEFLADVGTWEAEPSFTQGEGNTLAPLDAAISDEAGGSWTFASAPLLPVLLWGRTFDLNAAGEELLVTKSIRYSMQFAFTKDGQTFNPQQVAPALAAAAKLLRRRKRIPASYDYGTEYPYIDRRRRWIW